MFFKYLPMTDYEFGERNIKQVENLVVAVNPVDDIYDDRYFDTKLIGFETPEEVSEQLYRMPDNYWNVLYVNRVVNPFTGWVKSTAELEEYCLIKYKTKEEMFKVKYFVDVRTDQILVGIDEDKMHKYMEDNDGDLPVYIQKITFYEYEHRVNAELRNIRFVPENRLLSFNDRFETAMRINAGEIR